MSVNPRPLIAHVVYRFDTGGLENGVVNLINHLPDDAYRHVVVALTEVTDFARRIRRADVRCIALHKRPGQTWWLYPQLLKLFRALRPAIVHTRNLAALEVQPAAWLAGVPVRIHGEHGRDVGDVDGSNRTYQRVRRLYRPFVQHYVALSRDLQQYLVDKVHVPPQRITQIYNGVDTQRFHPSAAGPEPIEGCPFDPARHWLVGTVGRMQTVKDQPTLARAFVRALELQPALRERLRLVMVGDGPLRAPCEAVLTDAGVRELAWLPGERTDVPAVMRGLHAFALPSLAEGISNTILEAMASGLPVLATNVGGNADLVDEGATGWLVPAADVEAMAQALVRLAQDPAHAAAMGRAGRAAVEARFSLQAMVEAYQRVYADGLAAAGVLPPPSKADATMVPLRTPSIVRPGVHREERNER
ncbi:TIGR03088 family PEP-CTERM/XrtA system glycosyltransferase [Calidifontimicrobium sp. SYSU G02091]|uniref:TIGR03088 family PEP-CTERM/XrtA system glycosyltransferase n=1 Tax=Calidifontimicrobium sp. SYSU G02091 TaxID=2926421 RepID=UPI001F530986|nr:TIGR03088 family PEP-CTERM/XrtA system glycosyltransferase [Calidifontimicrobium sp. SYSU G02091]MCI1193126.1 TIGR03088 family PEP-CTERM/XrtA system glycosyltransferase [Calidifontimicrobium sp. SYSU G02091]